MAEYIDGVDDIYITPTRDFVITTNGVERGRISKAGSVTGLLGAGTPAVNLVAQYGISTSNTAAQNGALLDQAFSDHGGVQYVLPAAGTPYSFTGGHTLPYKGTFMGQGVGITEISHTSNDTFLTINTANGTEQRQGAKDFKLTGNSGASAKGIVFQDTNFGPYLERVKITGYTAGVGVQLSNATAGAYCEGVQLLNVGISNCATGVQFTRTGGTNSFKGFYSRQLGINVPDGGVGIDVGVGLDVSHPVAIYDSHLGGHIWFAGGTTAGTGWKVGQYGTINAFADFDFEAGGSGTTYWLDNAAGGVVDVNGRVGVASGLAYNITPLNTTINSPGWASPLGQGMGFKHETYPFNNTSGSVAVTSGKVYAVAVWLPIHATISTMWTWVDAVASTVTLARFGVWDQNWNLLGSTPNDTALFGTTGFRSKALSTPVNTPSAGIYYLGLLSVATTAGNFARSGLTISGGNARTGSNAYAFAAQGSLSDLPNPLVPGSGVAPLALWIAAT